MKHIFSKSRLLSLCLVLSLIGSVFSGMTLPAYADEQEVQTAQETQEEQEEQETTVEEIQTVEVPEQTEPVAEEEPSAEIHENKPEETDEPLPETAPEETGESGEAGETVSSMESSLTIEVPENDPVPLTIEVPENEIVIALYLDRPEEFELEDGTKKKLTPEESIRTFTVEAEHCENLLKEARPEDVVAGYEGVADGESHVFSFAVSGGTGTMEWQWFKRTGSGDLPAAQEEDTNEPLPVLSVSEPEDSGYYYLELRFTENGDVLESVKSNVITVAISAPEEPEQQSEEDIPVFLSAGLTEGQTEETETIETEEATDEEEQKTEEPKSVDTEEEKTEEEKTEESKDIDGEENTEEPEDMDGEEKKIEAETEAEKETEKETESVEPTEEEEKISNEAGEETEEAAPEEKQDATETAESESDEEILQESAGITLSMTEGPEPVLTGDSEPIEIVIEWKNAEEVANYTYDGKEKKPEVILKKNSDGTVINPEQYPYDVIYSDNKDAGEDTAMVSVQSRAESSLTFNGTKFFSIAKATPDITLKDKSAYYNRKEITIGNAAVKPADGGKYTGPVTYHYYTDSGCTKELSSAPVGAGTYYVVAETPAFENHTEGKSNVAKLVIIYAAKTVTAYTSASSASITSSKTVEIIYGESYSFSAKVTQSGYYIGRVYVNGDNVGSPSQYSDGTYYYTYNNNDPVEFTKAEKVSVVFQVYDTYGAPATGDSSNIRIMVCLMTVSGITVALCLTGLKKKRI